MKIKYPIQIVLFGLILVLIFPAIATADIHSIINQMERSYQKQIAGIEDITIVSEIKSALFTTGTVTTKTTQYHKKFRVNNEDILKTRTETSMMGMDDITIYDGEYTWAVDMDTGEVVSREGTNELTFAWKYFEPDKMQYLGEETIDGKPAYKVYWDDAIWMEDMEPAEMGDVDIKEAETETHSIYWIDKNDYVPLKVQNTMKQSTIKDGDMAGMSMISDIYFQDYRTVGSMLIPYKIVISTKWEFDDPDIDMGIMALFDAMGEMELQVVSVEYNTGLSDDLFDATKLEPGEPMFGDMPEDMSQEDIEAMMEGLMDMMQDLMPKD